MDDFSVQRCRQFAWRPYYRQLAIVDFKRVTIRGSSLLKPTTWSNREVASTLTVAPYSVCFDPSGRMLDPDTGKVVVEADRVASRFSSSGEYLSYCSLGENTGRWKFLLPTAFHEFTTPKLSDSGYAFDFGPDGRAVIGLFCG